MTPDILEIDDRCGKCIHFRDECEGVNRDEAPDQLGCFKRDFDLPD